MRTELFLMMIARDLLGVGDDIADVALSLQQEAEEINEDHCRRQEAKERGEAQPARAGIPTGPSREEMVLHHLIQRLGSLLDLLHGPGK